MITMLNTIISLFTRIAYGTQSIKLDLNMELITTNTVTDSNDEIRRIDFHFDNYQSLEGHNTIEGIYNSLFSNEVFINTFTNRSIVIITSGKQYNPDVSFNYHPNVYLPLGVETTYTNYFNKVVEFIKNRYDESGYVLNLIPEFKVTVWDISHMRNKTVKTLKAGKGKAHFSTSACVNSLELTDPVVVSSEEIEEMEDYINNLTEEDEKEITEYFKTRDKERKKEFMDKIKEENPLTDNFILHFDKDFADTSDENFATLDLETVRLPQHNDIQIPVCITHCSGDILDNRKSNNKYYQIATDNLTSVDLSLIQKDVTKMFKDLMNKITRNKLSRSNNRTIFVHNLGGFDGIFIHKALVEIYGTKITCLLDDSNKYVSITYKGEVIDTSKGKKLTEAQLKENKYTIEFKDSCRLFPVSLDLLCKVFKVEGKASKYNPLYNDVNLFDNLELLKTFKEYALQDTYSLRSALIKARSVYAGDWDVDIIKNFSNSGLSLKVYRHKFMESCKDYISVLTKPQDAIVRKSYFGGARLAAIITKRMVKIYTIMM